MEKHVKESRIAVRVRNINMLLLVIILLMISIMSSVMVTNITDEASKNLARFYSTETVDKFNLYLSEDLILVEKVSRSRAVSNWFADEENHEKRSAAYDEMMDYIKMLKSTNLHFVINETFNEFSISSEVPLEHFVPFDKIDQTNPENNWYFDCIKSQNIYTLNMDIDKVTNSPHLWINHKVIENDRIVGVFSSGLPFDGVSYNLFDRYEDSRNVKGYIINKNGMIMMDSSNPGVFFDEIKKYIQVERPDQVFTDSINSFLRKIDGYFSQYEDPIVVKLAKGPYKFASIAPIFNSDWSVVTFYNNSSLFDITHFFPLLIAMLSGFLLYTIAGSLMIRHLVIVPISSLTKSLADAKSSAENLYGYNRKDEIGELARGHMQMITGLEQRDNLLQTVNQVATILLQSDMVDFEKTLWQCMGMLGRTADADRVYIWKNHIKDNQLYCTQVYEWSEGAEPQQGNEYTIDIPYSENMPSWEETLSSGRCVNGIVRELSQEEYAQLSPQGILSILVEPVFLRDSFWGFVGFDDCHKERVFTENEETILRSGSLLIANALLRNEMHVRIKTALEKAQTASRAKTNFLSNMSHEIRTPMNAIIGMTKIGKSSLEQEKKDYAFEKIEGASNHLLGVINDILEMSKIEAGKFELSFVEFNLEKLLQKVINVISFRMEEKHQNFSMYLDPDIPASLYGDDIRLTQILSNLLTNAVKFTPDDGSIYLEAKLDKKADDIFIILFTVKDTGIGISAEQQKRLFTSFEQAESSTSRKFGGTGLGLAISKHITELMNGKIWVESEPGKGTSFFFTIEVKEGEDKFSAGSGDGEKTSIDTMEKNISYNGYRILLAEDVEINREILITMMAPLEIEFDCAVNGLEAVQMFAAEPDRYDLIFMDLQMPEMDGIEATKHIRAIKSPNAMQIPIVAMTANVFREDVERCIAAGMNDHVGKPLDFNEVLEKIKHYFNKNSA